VRGITRKCWKYIPQGTRHTQKGNRRRLDNVVDPSTEVRGAQKKTGEEAKRAKKKGDLKEEPRRCWGNTLQEACKH